MIETYTHKNVLKYLTKYKIQIKTRNLTIIFNFWLGYRLITVSIFLYNILYFSMTREKKFPFLYCIELFDIPILFNFIP